MKTLFALVLLVAATSGQLAQRQKDVLGLLFKTTEPIRDRFTNLKEASVNFVPSTGSYSDGGAAAAVLDKQVTDGSLLTKKHLFSLFNDAHRAEAVHLFEVLMYSNDWATFYSSAAYYRERMNEGSFTYALYVACLHASVAEGIVLPPLYEVTPHMFTNSEVIQKAYSAKMTQTPGKFKMDFTGSRKNPEQRVAYFGEDIGMNVHHVTWHMDFPFWWQDKYGYSLKRKGELFFWMHHQLTARFDSERLSNHLNLVDELYWDRPIYEGFAPETTYRYGGEFPARPDNVNFEDVDGVARIRDMIITETRIRDAIAHGYVTDKEGNNIDIRNENGINILGDVMESSTYSPNPQYYGALHNFAHIILGRQGDPNGKFNMPPGVMEHFETATRDPAFFRLHKYMDNIFKEHKDSLPSYTRDDILFDGVSVESVTVDGKLETYFQDFEFDLLMGVDDTQEVEDVSLSAVVSRLQHSDFTINYNIKNNGESRLATIRTFLCPQRDANGILFSLEEGRWNCIEGDKIWRTLAPGSNTISRSSRDASTTVGDIPSFSTLMETTEAALAAETDPDFNNFGRSCGIPNRMLLPKGTTEGMKFTVFVAVTDGSEEVNYSDLESNDYGGTHSLCGVSRGGVNPDKRPMGFPLDRRIPNAKVMMKFPNLFKTPVVITHRV